MGSLVKISINSIALISAHRGDDYRLYSRQVLCSIIILNELLQIRLTDILTMFLEKLPLLCNGLPTWKVTKHKYSIFKAECDNFKCIEYHYINPITTLTCDVLY